MRSKLTDRQIRWLWAGAIGGTAVLLFLPAPWPQLAAFLLLAVWPTTTWLLGQTGHPVERLLTAAALPLLVNSLFVLALTYVPGPVSRPVLVLGMLALAWWPLWRTRRQTLRAFLPDWSAFSRQQWALAVLLALTAAGFRLVNLGYSEFQGDEGVIMTRAAAAIVGRDAAIFLHQKGPLEILQPLALWHSAGTVTEVWARLPFAWAAVLAVGAVALSARRWFGERTGWWAGFLFVIMGFGVAFGRIVQYQSFVMLWSTLAVLHMDRYEKEGQRADLWLTAVFLAGGLLAHYDAILVAPALLWLFYRRWRRAGVRWSDVWTAGALGLAILLLFYLPFVSNPNFARTGNYLLRGRVGVSETTGVFSWSGTAVWQMVTLYNSLYFVAGLGLLAVWGLWRVWREKQGETAVWWLLAPLLFYLFIVVDPRTHVYTFFPAAIVLAAAGADTLMGARAKERRRFWLVGGALILWWLVSAVYVYQIFIDNTPERVRTWAENRPRFYPTTWTEPPLYGLFGFPHQTGWRVAAELIPASSLPYASNEEQEISGWYMGQALRTHCSNFGAFVLVTNAQDELPYDAALLAEWPVVNEVAVNGRPAMQIYRREGETVVVPLEAAGEKLWRTPSQIAPPQSGGQNSTPYTLGDQAVRLVGYDLDLRQAYPGGQITVTLHWLALVPFAVNYQVFTHLYDGQMRAQHDGAPECGIMPTTRWEPGQLISDPHVMAIPGDTPPGNYPLTVGMYNLITSERMVIDQTGQDIIELTDIPIRILEVSPTE